MPLIRSNRDGQLVADLRAIPKEVRKELRPALKKAGEAVAVDARARASWSRRIPGAIVVRVLYGGARQGVVIRVRQKLAPHARPYEGIGTRRSGGGEFRHPVYGNVNRWVTQKTKPYLHPAAQAKASVTRALVVRVVEDAARRHGLS